MAARRKAARAATVVTLEGEKARAVLPEGSSASMPLVDLVSRLQPSAPDTRGIVLPDGTKALLPTQTGLILVHQTPPSVFSFRWIANDSKARHGPKTTYRTVRIGLPYVIVLAVYQGARGGVPQLTSLNECFFSNEPLERNGLDSKLCFPALLNCSKFRPATGRPLSWICTQHLPEDEFAGRSDLESSVRDGLRALLRHLFESGFNLSSEDHELCSWFSASVKARIDPRIMTIEKWVEATEKEPLFALDVPWLPTGRTLREITERVHYGSPRRAPFSTSDDFARVILNAGKTEKRRSK
jgi:hypothetical protein